MFTSCENFLNGGDIKKEIEDRISYANAESYKIKINYSGNTGALKSPAGGEAVKKVTDKFAVNFEPTNDMVFVRWSIIDSATNEELPNGTYLEFASPSESETECTFVKAPSNGTIIIEPVLAKRPKILASTPIYGVDACKDSSIQVLFDHDMSPDSIYYTDDEIAALMEKGVDLEKTENSNKYFLQTTVNGELKYYGYVSITGARSGTVEHRYYKNILITGSDENSLNNSFLVPVFANPRQLYIPVNKNNPVSDWSQVIVTLDKGFFYEEDGKPITMLSDEKWVYQVSNEYDTQTPSVVKCQVGGTLLKTQSEINITTIDSHPLYRPPTINDSKKVTINLEVHDSGSGPASTFLLKLQKVGKYRASDGKFESCSSSLREKRIEYHNVPVQRAVFTNGIVDLSDMISDGIYGMYFVLEDRGGNKLIYPSDGQKYYFVVQSNSPTPIPENLTAVSKADGSVTVAWLISGNNFDQYSISWEGLSKSGISYSGSDVFGKEAFSYTINGVQGDGSLKVKLCTKTSAGVEGAYEILDVYSELNPGVTLSIPIEYIYTISGKTLVTGRIAKGDIYTGLSVQIVGNAKTFDASVNKIEMYNRALDYASVGDNVGIYLDTDVTQSDLARGMYLCRPGEMQNHTKFKAYIHLKTTAEGGRTYSVSSGYRPQFYFDVSDVTGTMSFDGSINPGENRIVEVTLNSSMPIYSGQSFIIREGGRPVGSGTIMSVVD